MNKRMDRQTATWRGEKTDSQPRGQRDGHKDSYTTRSDGPIGRQMEYSGQTRTGGRTDRQTDTQAASGLRHTPDIIRVKKKISSDGNMTCQSGRSLPSPPNPPPSSPLSPPYSLLSPPLLLPFLSHIPPNYPIPSLRCFHSLVGLPSTFSPMDLPLLFRFSILLQIPFSHTFSSIQLNPNSCNLHFSSISLLALIVFSTQYINHISSSHLSFFFLFRLE